MNCAAHFKGLYTSYELPHFIANMAFETPGNPVLGQLLARECSALAVETLTHDATTLNPEYGTLVPMRCVMARSVVNRGTAPFGVHEKMGDAPSVRRTCEGLDATAAHSEPAEGKLLSFVAAFPGVPPASEREFNDAIKA